MTRGRAIIDAMQVEMPGRFGRTMPARGWPNLVEIAGAALRHYDEICDTAYHYVPYVGASLGWPTPCFNHHRWDWIEVLPYPLIGRIAARRITGYLGGAEIERRQRQLLLSAFHNLDGFAYPHYVRGWSERTRLCLWEQGRVMFALLAWFEETQDERLLAYVRGIVAGLMRISHREGGHRVIDAPHDTDGAFSVLSPASMVECLTKYAALTGDPDALELCDGIVHSLLRPATGFTDSSHRLSGSLRGCAAAISGLTRYAVHVQDDRLLERAEGLCRTALSLIAEGGATPEEEPCCTLMEMTTALLALTAAGRGDHWDTVDRWFRNTVVECQFRDPSALNLGYAPGEPKPWDDTRDIVNRSLGGFFWASPYEYLCWRIRLMTCCSGHAIWTLGKIADHAVMDEGPAGGISVNLHYTLETPLAAVSCHEPFAGRLEVIPARTGPVRIRVPPFATEVTVSLDGAEVPHAIRDGYLALDRIPAGATVTLDYPLPERHGDQVVRIPQAAEGGTGAYFGLKADPIVGHRIPTRWRGNTVMAIDYADGRSRRPLEGVPGPAPQQPRHRLFATREARFSAAAGRDDRLVCFLPERRWIW